MESVTDCCINERSPGLAEASWIGTLGKLVRSGLRETASQKVKQRVTKDTQVHLWPPHAHVRASRQNVSGLEAAVSQGNELRLTGTLVQFPFGLV